MAAKWNGLAGLFDNAAPTIGVRNATPTPRAPRKRLNSLPTSNENYKVPQYEKGNSIKGFDSPRFIRPGAMEDYDMPRYIAPKSNLPRIPNRKVNPDAPVLGPILNARPQINPAQMGMLNSKPQMPVVVRPGRGPVDKPVIEPNATARHPLKNRLQNIDIEETTYNKQNDTSSLPGEKPPLVVVPGTKVIDPYVSGREQLKARRAAAWNEQGHVYGPKQAHFAATGFGGAGAAVAGSLIGGTTAYMGSTQENRGFGTFMKGAAFGAGAGAVVSGIASRGMISGGAEWANQVAKKFEFGEGFTENAISVTRGMETAQARGALFAAGAMLGGGMFGTNRNRAQGLNSTRGNRFGG